MKILGSCILNGKSFPFSPSCSSKKNFRASELKIHQTPIRRHLSLLIDVSLNFQSPGKRVLSALVQC